nr:hypothetical protein [Tanacetum cinerariifolium]
MERIGDDLLISIFDKLHNENDRKSFSKVSKPLLKVACILVKVLHVSSPDVLKNILLESPNKVEFKCLKPLSNTYMKLLARLSPKLQKLDLELKYKPCELDFDDDGLRTVANACSHLRQIVLSRRLRVGDLGVDSIVRSRLRVGDLGVDSIVRSCKNLQELDLSGCLSITDESLKAIGESNSLLILNLSYCLITDMGLEYLADGNLTNSLTGLDLSGCYRISDDEANDLTGCEGITRVALHALFWEDAT